jgi:hypothetical protein
MRARMLVAGLLAFVAVTEADPQLRLWSLRGAGLEPRWPPTGLLLAAT